VVNALGIICTFFKPTLRRTKDKYFADTDNLQIGHLHALKTFTLMFKEVFRH